MNYQFNLQPWREVKRAEQKKGFIATSVIVGISLIALLGLDYYVEDSYISSQVEAKSFLQKKIQPLKKAKEEVDKIIKMNKELNNQIGVIRDLQNDRKKLISTLDAMSKAVPETVFLDKIVIDESGITIEGIAASEKSIAEFMRSLGQITNINEPTLKRIESAKSSDRYSVPEGTEIKSFVINTAYKDK